MLDEIDREAMREGFAISKSQSYRTIRPLTPRGVSREDVKRQDRVEAPMVALLARDHRTLSTTEVANRIAAAMSIIN